MRFTFLDPEVFVKLLECVSKFVNKAHFDIGKNGIRVRSIDPSDFCYVDIFLAKSFFNLYEASIADSFGIDVSKFSRFLPSMTSGCAVSMIVEEGYLLVEATGNWTMQFRVNFLEQDPYDLSEPRNLDFEASVEIPSKEFSGLVNTASTISNELNFSIEGKQFTLSTSSGDYEYSGEPSKGVRIENNGNQKISAYAIANYIKTLRELINKCETVRISLGNNKPVRLDLKYQDKGFFSFWLSNRRLEQRQKTSRRDGTSLPRLTVTRLPEFLLYLANCPDGEESRFLREAGFETAGGDYGRISQQLNLAERIKGKIRLSRQGEIFTNLMQNDQEQARNFINGLALAHIESYKVMIEALSDKALTPDELYEEINSKLKEKSRYPIDRQDLSTLLGLAIWCKVLDRKLALYYLKKGGME